MSNYTNPDQNKNQSDTIPPEPTLIFFFDNISWNSKLNYITKLELLDFVPYVSSSFYYDEKLKSFVLLITKSKWDTLSSVIKTKFTHTSLRIKREIDGLYINNMEETADLFEIYEKNHQNDTESEESRKKNTTITGNPVNLENTLERKDSVEYKSDSAEPESNQDINDL